MDLAGWRDIIIVIWGIIGIIVSIVVSVVIILLYRKTTALVESSKLIMEKVGGIVNYTNEELIRPISRLGAMIKGIEEGLSLFTRLFRKKEEDNE